MTTRQWTNAGAANDWYTAANWAPATPAGAWTPGDIAEFNNTGTATLAEINFNTGNLSLGAISNAARTHDLTIGNISPVPGTGLLQLNGATVNGVNNVVLSTSLPPHTLFLEDKLSGMLSHMEIVLGNNIDNVILLDNEMGSAINISAPISGAGKKLTLGIRPGGGSAGILTLSGANTYTGITTVNARHGCIVLARFGGGTLPDGNDVAILDGKMIIKSNQTLHNVTVGSQGVLEIATGVTLTIKGRLDNGTVISPGRVTGNVVYV